MSKVKKESKLHAFIKKNFMIIVVFAIMFIPSIYTVLFLGSMWDPYGNTGSLPVAIVNEDKAVFYGDKEINIGEELCDNLRKNDSLQFNFVDEQVALDGLENSTYYMVMVIPSDFSYNSTTLTSENPQKMEMTYYTNPGTNYIASKFGESAIKTIKESLSATVIRTYATTVYSKLDTIGVGFTDAADGSNQIYNGVGTLRNGNNSMIVGLTTLSNGCLTLKEGAGTLEDGLKQYTNGVNQVNNGMSQLEDGSTQLSDGIVRLSDGTTRLKNGTTELKNGVGDLGTGVGKIKAGTSQLVENNDTINDGAQQLLDGMNLMSDSIGQSLTDENLQQLETLENGLIEINDGIQLIGSYLDKVDLDEETIEGLKSTVNDLDELVKSGTLDDILELVNSDLVDWDYVIETIESMQKITGKNENLEKLKIFAEKMKAIQGVGSKLTKDEIENTVNTVETLLENYDELESKLNRLVEGSQQALPTASSTLKTLTNGLLSVKNGLDRTKENDGETGLIEGMTTLQNGLLTYTNGVEQVDNGVGLAQMGVVKLNDGAIQLDDGAKQLYDGVGQLKDGVASAGDGINQLYSGTQKLVSNNDAILDGSSKIFGGSEKLYDGSVQLLDGSYKIDDGCGQLMLGANTLELALRDGAKQISVTNTGEDAAEMFSSPVEAKEIFQRNINSNGEAMSAYMMCAGLWVCCLAFCLMFSPFKTSLKDRKTFVGHVMIAGFVAVVSATLMVTLIMAIDGMRPAHVVETYFMAILASLTFMSIVYFLNTLLDSIGSFALLIFLCLQLSGSAGTYPICLSPKFYQIIHPFLPFTYGVDAFRSTISTGNPLTKDILVFIGIFISCSVLTLITYEVRKHKLAKQNRIEEIIEIQEEVEYYNNPETI